MSAIRGTADSDVADPHRPPPLVRLLAVDDPRVVEPEVRVHHGLPARHDLHGRDERGRARAARGSPAARAASASRKTAAVLPDRLREPDDVVPLDRDGRPAVLLPLQGRFSGIGAPLRRLLDKAAPAVQHSGPTCRPRRGNAISVLVVDDHRAVAEAHPRSARLRTGPDRRRGVERRGGDRHHPPRPPRRGADGRGHAGDGRPRGDPAHPRGRPGRQGHHAVGARRRPAEGPGPGGRRVRLPVEDQPDGPAGRRRPRGATRRAAARPGGGRPPAAPAAPPALRRGVRAGSASARLSARETADPAADGRGTGFAGDRRANSRSATRRCGRTRRTC